MADNQSTTGTETTETQEVTDQTAEVQDEAKDIEHELENMEVSFDDLEDDDDEEESTDDTEADAEDEEEAEDDADEDESEDDPEVEEEADTEKPAKELSDEEKKKAFNREMAEKRIAEKQEREKSQAEAQKKYLDEAKGDKDRAIRELQVEAYNNKVEKFTNTLTNSYEKAIKDFPILTDKSPAVQAEVNAAVDAFQAMHVSVDNFGHPIDVREDFYTYLQKKADSIEKLTQVGARKEVQSKSKAKAKTIAMPSRAPKEGKKDEGLVAFDEEANKW